MMENINEFGFLKLPNNMVWEKNKEEKSLLSINKNIPYIYLYLESQETKYKLVHFTLEHLINCSGKTPRRGVGKTNEIFKEGLKQVLSLGLIQLSEDLDEIKSTAFLEGNSLVDYSDMGSEYFIVYRKVISCLMNIDTKVDRISLLNTYLYINARIRRREIYGNYESDIYRDGGRAEVFYDTQENIVEDLQLGNKRVLEEYLKILKDNNFIYYGNIGKITKDGKIRTASNIYALKYSEYTEGLKQSRLYYIDQGWKVPQTA